MASRKLLVALAVVVSLSYAQGAGAFMSFELFGGAIHADICRKALGPEGLSRASLKKIIQGCNSQDLPWTKKFSSSPPNHCDDDMIAEGIRYWQSRVGRAVEDSGSADSSVVARDRALYAMGEALHTLQDFYSHSNYVEYLEQRSLPLEPVDWGNIPGAVHSGHYFFASVARNENTSSRKVSVAKLMMKNPGLAFHSEHEYEARCENGSLTAALLYVLGSHDLLHLELNKDSPKTLEGKVLRADGKSLHQLARSVAELDTRRQWQAFEQAVRVRWGSRASAIIGALKGSR